MKFKLFKQTFISRGQGWIHVRFRVTKVPNKPIINIEDMQPQTQDAHCTKKPARYALEMNQGWFKQKNLKPGTKVGGLPK